MSEIKSTTTNNSISKPFHVSKANELNSLRLLWDNLPKVQYTKVALDWRCTLLDSIKIQHTLSNNSDYKTNF